MSEVDTSDKRRAAGRELSVNECQALRHLRAAGWSRGELKMVFEISPTAISRHLDEECGHPDVAPPLAADAPDGEELKKFRFAHDLTQAEAGERFDVTPATWSAWEQEAKVPHPDNARRLQEAIAQADLPQEVPDDWNNRGRPQHYTDAEILDALDHADSVVSGRMTLEKYKEFRGSGLPSVGVVYDRFGSFTRAVNLATEDGDSDE